MPEMRQIHVDVQRLLSIDSAGLGMFLLARDEAKHHQKILTLTQGEGQVSDMFEVAQFSTLFAI